MKTDDRDERLASILDEAVHDIGDHQLQPPVPTIRVIGRPIRVIAAVAAAAVFVAGVVFASGQFGRDSLPGGDGIDTVVEGSFETDKWQLERPFEWITAPFNGCGTALPRGLIVSNVEFEFLNPDGQIPSCNERMVFAGFPNDGVAIDLEPEGGRGIFPEPLADTPLPIEPSQLIATDGIAGGPRMSYLVVVVDGESTAIIRMWVGPEASTDDIDAAHRILRSMWIRGADRWEGEQFESDGVRISVIHPEDWKIDRFSLFGVADAPNPVMSLTSPDIAGDASRVCGPWVLFTPRKLSPMGVAIVVSDASGSWVPPDVGQRPDVLSPATALADRTVNCRTGSFRKLHFAFDVVRKPILVDVLMGSLADEQLSPIVWRILESLDFPTEASAQHESVALPPPVRVEYRSEFVSQERGLRFWPRSGRAEEGVLYRFEVPLCGLDWTTDFDGSFWQAVYPPGRRPFYSINGDVGTMTLIEPDRARYVASDGNEIELFRLDGPIVRGGCE